MIQVNIPSEDKTTNFISDNNDNNNNKGFKKIDKIEMNVIDEIDNDKGYSEYVIETNKQFIKADYNEVDKY